MPSAPSQLHAGLALVAEDPLNNSTLVCPACAAAPAVEVRLPTSAPRAMLDWTGLVSFPNCSETGNHTRLELVNTAVWEWSLALVAEDPLNNSTLVCSACAAAPAVEVCDG